MNCQVCLEGSGLGLLEALHRRMFGGTDRSTEHPVSIDGVPSWIRTGNLPNIRLARLVLELPGTAAGKNSVCHGFCGFSEGLWQGVHLPYECYVGCCPQAGRQAETDTDKTDTDRQADTDRQTRHTETGRQTQTDGQTETDTQRQTNTEIDTDRQTHRQTDRQTLNIVENKPVNTPACRNWQLRLVFQLAVASRYEVWSPVSVTAVGHWLWQELHFCKRVSAGLGWAGNLPSALCPCRNVCNRFLYNVCCSCFGFPLGVQKYEV
jgi:hypothetical protein